MRTFLACCIDAATASQLYAALEPMRKCYDGAAFAWIAPSNYHVTLRFFGELESAAIDRVAELTRVVALAAAPMECHVEAARPLPGPRRPNVIVLPIGSAGRLERLAAQFQRALEPEFGASDKPFKAHLTVIRCNRGARIVEPRAAIEFELSFTRVALFESTQFRGSVRYTPLHEFRLGGGS